MGISKERGSTTMSVVSPILAALIGGAAAIGAATQVVNLAPSNADPGPAPVSQSSVAGESADVQYNGN